MSNIVQAQQVLRASNYVKLVAVYLDLSLPTGLLKVSLHILSLNRAKSSFTPKCFINGNFISSHCTCPALFTHSSPRCRCSQGRYKDSADGGPARSWQEVLVNAQVLVQVSEKLEKAGI